MLSGIPEEERFSAEMLVADLADRGVSGRHFPNTDLVLDYLKFFLFLSHVTLRYSFLR